ncbi:type 1 glutamine amidotransferase domain-containing protein [Phenylobacterium glaciei]|uniref:type 1 glutamine amidotransferase domain-containing protein n=1 Tax=Phenylobacterium glaciei TaxID=2803784 RepID=UPI003D31BE3B
MFFPGGHGPMWDLAESAEARRLVEAFAANDRPIAAVCHAPAVFRRTVAANGEPLVSGRRVTGFTNSEEDGVGLSQVVPFLLEDMLKANGGLYEKGPDQAPYIVRDGNLVTGQNPASSGPAARELLQLLKA